MSLIFYFLTKYAIFEHNITIFHVIFSCHYRYFAILFLSIQLLNDESYPLHFTKISLFFVFNIFSIVYKSSFFMSVFCSSYS